MLHEGSTGTLTGKEVLASLAGFQGSPATSTGYVADPLEPSAYSYPLRGASLGDGLRYLPPKRNIVGMDPNKSPSRIGTMIND